MKKLIMAMAAAAMAAAAMVGAANAAVSYEYEADVTVSNYAAKDSDPSDEHAGWYSCYCLTQESAKEATDTWRDTVTYETYAEWLEQNFAVNKQKTIDEAQSVSYDSCDGSSYHFYSMGSGEEPFLTDALCVMFFDNGKDSAYNVTKCDAGNSFRCDEPGSHFSSGWIAVPEPTSGLLMLLGMAGLALKRKRA